MIRWCCLVTGRLSWSEHLTSDDERGELMINHAVIDCDILHQDESINREEQCPDKMDSCGF